MLPIFLIILCLLLIAAWLGSPRIVPWADHLTRLNPGAGENAEWMAPPQVIEQVIWDYRQGQEWLNTSAMNWGRFAERVDDYTCGAYLERQRHILESLMHNREPRLSSVVAASHELAVRHFSSDGLRCLLIDRQTARTISTLEYWKRKLVNRQRLGNTTFVYQMQYDMRDKRWKIAQLLQELSPVSGNKVRVTVSAEALSAAGRDS